MGCEDPTKPKESNSATKKNTLNDPNLGNETGYVHDYFFDFDEEINARYLYYNSFLTRGANTISNPSQLEPYQDTLNFQTFPYYIAEIENGNTADTISYLLSLTPEIIDEFSTLYPLDELNASNLNWCNELLVEYAGNCPESVEVSFDYQVTTTGTGAIYEDTLKRPAEFLNIRDVKDTTFPTNWTDISSLVWDNDLERYSVVTDTITQTLSSTVTNTDDYFDSLIYIAIIDTSRISVSDLMFVDRTEWERFDIINKSEDYPHVLADTFRYSQVLLVDDAPMYRINGDCNQNLQRDLAEEYFDFGPDWCPDSLETGADTYTDVNENGFWEESEPFINDWNEDGKWTKAFCEVTDLDSDGDIVDEDPCNCGNEVNAEWVVAKATSNEANCIEKGGYWLTYGTNECEYDPNGDNWRDCGIDGYCPGNPKDTNSDENGTELNGVWDPSENMEANGSYDFDIINGIGEYFVDKPNGVPDEPAEFCVTGSDGVCDLSDLFEDRNCNGKWDDAESGDQGNGIWDDDEAFQNLDNSIESDPNSDRFGKPTWNGNEPLYAFSDRLGNFIVDYSDPEYPVQITEIDTNTTVTFYFGTIDNSVFICNVLIYDESFK